MNISAENIQELYSRAGQHYAAGRMQEAANLYGQILKVNPGHVETQYMLGMVFYRSGMYEKADVLVSAALSANPTDMHIYCKAKGDILRNLLRIDDAIFYYKKAIEINPVYTEAINNLASIYLSKGDLGRAHTYFEKALVIKPDYVPALYNLGLIAKKNGQRERAKEFLQKTVEYRPDHADAWRTISEIFIQEGDLKQAQTAIEKSLLEGVTKESLLISSALANRRGDYKLAIEQLETALLIAPDDFDILKNLGALYSHLDMYEKACFFCEKALELRPSDSELLNNLGNAYKGFGLLEKSVSYYKAAIENDPDDSRIYSNLLLAMIYSAESTPEEIAMFSRNYGDLIERSVKRHQMRPRNLDPERRLRIGYVSPDFRNHSVNYFFEHILERHDRNNFEIYGYSSAPDTDAVTERLKAKFDKWRDIYSTKNDESAALIDEDEIDILIDMAGHTANNRLLVFARRPAPVQVSWLGYPATTGIKTMDYRITDHFAEPIGMTEHLNTENLLRMPDIFCCYGIPGKVVSVREKPCFEDNGYITFGCFNTFTKVTDPVLRCWQRIMSRVPESRLLLEIRGIELNTKFREEVFARLHDSGLPMDRVILEPRKKENQFILYNRIDIALDPFPCAGGTTSMDTLWMGVPLITLAGGHFVSRMGVTILSNAGLSELIALTEDEYIEKAVEIALDLDKLQRIRAGLRAKVMASPLMDGDRFTRNLEKAYRRIWQDWCARA